MNNHLPAIVGQPSAFTFAPGDRVMRTYPLGLLARIGHPGAGELGTVVEYPEPPHGDIRREWVMVVWDSAKEGRPRSFVNPAYLRKVG